MKVITEIEESCHKKSKKKQGFIFSFIHYFSKTPSCKTPKKDTIFLYPFYFLISSLWNSLLEKSDFSSLSLLQFFQGLSVLLSLLHRSQYSGERRLCGLSLRIDSFSAWWLVSLVHLPIIQCSIFVCQYAFVVVVWGYLPHFHSQQDSRLLQKYHQCSSGLSSSLVECSEALLIGLQLDSVEMANW